ncbi:acetolactate synthase catalytic subunit, partial [Candidatus Bathyarchaeota archaeon B24-2]
CKIAEGFNLVGKRVEEPEKLEKAFKEALNSDVPTVIEVPVVPMHVEIPPVATWVDLTKKK